MLNASTKSMKWQKFRREADSIDSGTKNIIFINSENFVNMIEQCYYICSYVPETAYLIN